MRWSVRCSKESCKRRATFKKHPDAYKRPRRCVGCGGTRFRVIKDIAKERGGATCMCASFEWRNTIDRASAIGPHRRGSPTCAFNADGSTRYPHDTAGDSISVEGEYLRWVVWCSALSCFAGSPSEGWRGFAAAVLAQELDSPADPGDTALGGL